jgi:crotonobetainyl-CoA:carnitine CoA-transferase CaiB-like acyl-CoA transferase
MFTAIGAQGMSGDNAGAPDRSADIWGGGRYQCADGRWVFYATANPRFVEALVEVGGVSHWREDGLLDRKRLAAEPELLAELRRRVAALFRTRPALEWETLLADAGAPITLIRTPEEWIRSDHARESGAVVPVRDFEYGEMLQAGFPVHLSATAPSATHGRSEPDSDRDAVLAGLASSNGVRVGGNGSQGAPDKGILEGLRVLDLTQVLAGPTGGRTLAEYGADVIKINNPDNPPLGYRYHIDVNRGKRTMLLDLKTPEGMEAFWRLVDGADIVMQNFARGVAERMGIGYEQVKQRNPRAIYASVSAFGYNGSWGDRRGYEPLGQGITGLQHRFGGGKTPAMQPFPVTDYGTGVLFAFAMALGLYHRERTGETQHVEASLAYTGTMLQSPFMQLYDGKLWDEPQGQDALGSRPLHRLYEASDGWLFLGARESEAAKLAEAKGLHGVAELAGDALSGELESRFSQETVETWIARIVPLGIGATALPTVRQIMADPWVKSHGLRITREHEGVGMVTAVGPPTRISPSPVQPGRPVRPPGADGREVLAEIGMGTSADALAQKKVLAEP